MSTPLIHVFVYGTLKPGEVNDWIYRGWEVEFQPAIVHGLLYHLPLGYPAIIPGEGMVQGFVAAFSDPEFLQTLDDFEQHDPEEFASFAPNLPLAQYQYQRESIPAFTPEGQPLGMAWVYRMTLFQVDRLGGVPIPDGVWSSK